MEEAVKTCCIKHVAQKVRKEVKTKAKKSQKIETCGKKEEEKKVGVHLITLEQDNNTEHHPPREHWEIPDYGIQVQRSTSKKQHKLPVFQEG